MITKTDTLRLQTGDTTFVDSLLSGEIDSLSVPHLSNHLSDNEVVQLPNFFHTSHSEGMPLKPRNTPADSWISPLLLSLFFFASILVSFYSKELKSLAMSPFRKDGFRKLNAEESFLMRRTLWSLVLIFLLVFPVFIYQTLAYRNFQLKLILALPLYLQMLGIGAGLVGLKLIVIRLSGILFLCRKETDIYQFGNMLMLGVIGLILIPICLLGQFATDQTLGILLTSAWLLVGLSYLSSLIIGTSAALASLRISKFHLILYFCTLELLPAIFILKVIRNMA